MKMLAFALAMVLASFLAGCGQQEPPKQAAAPAAVVPAPPVKTHNYSLKDGYEYGYERAVSAVEQQRGQATSVLIMAKYAGQYEGKYQIYMKPPEQPGSVVVAECSNPCEFMKVMVFFQGEHVTTERMRTAPGIIGWMILEDAINGELEQYVAEKNGRKIVFRFDEKKGLITSPLAEVKNAP